MTKGRVDPSAVAQLYEAINAGDEDRVRQLVDHNSGLIEEYGSCLHDASTAGHVELVRFFLERGLDIDEEADVGGTALRLACSNGHLEVVRYLVDKGASLKAPRPDRNPLFATLHEGHAHVAKLLLDSGFDPHIVYRGAAGKLRNALSAAQEYGRTEIVDLLVKAGCRLPIEGVDKPVWEPEEAEEMEPDASAHEELVDYMSEVFGPVEPLAIQEIVPVHEDVHVAIHVIHPNELHPYLVLFTVGMSDRPMNVPEGQEEYQYAELVMRLPADWPDLQAEGAGAETLWPVQHLRQIAYYPHLEDTWLGGETAIFTAADPPAPLGPNTKQTCLLLVADFPQRIPFELSDGRKIRLYTVYPIYTDERDFEKEHGVVALLRRLQERGCTAVADLTRPSVAGPNPRGQ